MRQKFSRDYFVRHPKKGFIPFGITFSDGTSVEFLKVDSDNVKNSFTEEDILSHFLHRLPKDIRKGVKAFISDFALCSSFGCPLGQACPPEPRCEGCVHASSRKDRLYYISPSSFGSYQLDYDDWCAVARDFDSIFFDNLLTQQGELF